MGEFLRAMRARRKPEAAAGRRKRRTPGLRREEVAELAGVSVDWYIRLEQGRAERPSGAVLDALARALDLSPPERRYLYRVGRGEEPAGQLGGEAPHPSLVAALEAIVGLPAIILGPRFDVLAANAPGEALFCGFGEGGRFARNAAFFTLCDPRARSLFVDYRQAASSTVGALRGNFGRRPLDASFLELIAELSARSPLFVALWAEQHVVEKGLGRKRFQHPAAGRLDLTVHTLAAPSADGQLLAFYAPRDEDTRAGLSLLLAAAPAPKAAPSKPAVRPRARPRGAPRS